MAASPCPVKVTIAEDIAALTVHDSEPESPSLLNNSTNDSEGSENDTKEKRVNFAAMAATQDSTDGEPIAVPLKKEGCDTAEVPPATEDVTPTDTTSEVFSASDIYSTNSSAGNYEVIEYDLNDNGGMFSDIEPHIEENTPAAAALRANANVRVSSMGKVARKMHMQSVRRLVKRATGHGRSGIVKGKPPRLPPRHGGSYIGDSPSYDEELGNIEEESEYDNMPSEMVASVPSSPPSSQIVVSASSNAQSPPVDSSAIIPDAVVAGTAEAGKKVLVSVDPHDMLKMLRWRRKKKGPEKERKSYVKGKVIDGEHELYTLSIAVMIGVRTSISKTNSILNSGPKRWVLPQDFRTTEKYEFRPKGDTTTPPHRLAHTFKFKDYCPVVFAYLRRMFGNNEFDFLLSVCGNANFIEFISNAKSGQFFFYSSDGKYMIKTMTNSESRFLRRILPDYFRHCCENPNTMVTRFYGMYRVKLYHLRRNVKFVIMNSVYDTDKNIQTIFDLKGSYVGRDAKPGQAVLKDNDLRRMLPEEALALSPPLRSSVRLQMLSDTDFLQKMGIMDYSMLVGVHHVPPEQDKSVASSHPRSSPYLLDRHRRSHTSSEFEITLERPSHYRSKTLDGETSMSQFEIHFTPDPRDSNEKIKLSSESLPDPLPRSGRAKTEGFVRPDPISQSRRQLSDATHRRNGTDQVGGFFLDDGLDDDDNSYLEGSRKRPIHIRRRTSNDDTEYKKQVTVEKLFWPFHRLYNIHGHRLMEPVRCASCGYTPCECDQDLHLLKGYKIPKFIAPLSERKDGGLELDTTGLALPLKYQSPDGPKPYVCKIFYMGIIDVLQEYTSRKKLEAQYRAMQTARMAASCVHPQLYGERFVNFFDEYSQRKAAMGVEIELDRGVRESNSYVAEN